MTERRTADDTARRTFGEVELRAADGVILVTLALFSLLAVGFRAAM